MEQYIIETINGDDYITSLADNFTLKVIPPEKQHEDRAYTPYQVVGAVFEDDANEEPPAWMQDPNADIPEDWNWGEDLTYDFEGINISFADDDMAKCNKEQWLGAITWYCERIVGKVVVALSPYNYNYELSERNCTVETLTELNGTQHTEDELRNVEASIMNQVNEILLTAGNNNGE